MKESAWKALDRVMALLRSGAGVVEGIGTALVHDSAAIESVEFAPIVDKRKAA
ncbi:unnamed protein product [Dovyalis caffra]|uniref:Uncharacterized protein n=1 Tax=Dovyalis caffra TaxID=77055 RepID=A0AAV1R8J9_9ROSI|nr:unnamed protein product [Dovyalis caffra]